jgi:hypothetical protein
MMAVRSEVRPGEVGRSLGAELARAEGLVEGLWMTTRPGVLTFWVLTQPIDAETQRCLYERTAVLYDQFPDIAFEVHILNPEWYEGGDAAAELPQDAHRIALPVT